jgi:hypothetical protein
MCGVIVFLDAPTQETCPCRRLCRREPFRAEIEALLGAIDHLALL